MNVRQYIRPDIVASAIAHLSVLAALLVLTEVHPFGGVTAEPITVDIVRLDEVGAKVEPDLQLQLPSSDVLAANEAKQPAGEPAPEASAAPPPQQQPPPQKQAALEQKPQTKQAQQPPPQPAPSPLLGYTPPEPDITVKYHVMLGLAEGMPVTLPKSSGDMAKDKSGDGGDATASTKADLSSSVIEDFRRHLKTCSKLPASVTPSDKVMVKLRVVMTPQGRLATDPILMAASASAKGPLLMRSAMAALNACQPYTMLPPNRYGEWKVIDLSFTPEDFSS